MIVLRHFRMRFYQRWMKYYQYSNLSVKTIVLKWKDDFHPCNILVVGEVIKGVSAQMDSRLHRVVSLQDQQQPGSEKILAAVRGSLQWLQIYSRREWVRVFGFSQDGETAEHVQRKSCVPRNLLQDCLPQIIRNPVIETSDDRFKIGVKIIDNRVLVWNSCSWMKLLWSVNWYRSVQGGGIILFPTLVSHVCSDYLRPADAYYYFSAVNATSSRYACLTNPELNTIKYDMSTVWIIHRVCTKLDNKSFKVCMLGYEIVKELRCIRTDSDVNGREPRCIRVYSRVDG